MVTFYNGSTTAVTLDVLLLWRRRAGFQWVSVSTPLFWCIWCLTHLVPKTCGGLSTAVAWDEDASYCYEKEEFLMGVVQYCGPALVTGQLAWRCTQANLTSKIYFTAQLFSLGPLWISLGVSLPVIWVQSVAWIGRLSSDWCHNWFPARPNRRRTAF